MLHSIYIVTDYCGKIYSSAWELPAPNLLPFLYIIMHMLLVLLLSQVFFNTEPFHDGYGLLTVDGIPKPSFRAFQLLKRLGNFSVAVQWDKEKTTEVSAFVIIEQTNATVQVCIKMCLHLAIL